MAARLSIWFSREAVVTAVVAVVLGSGWGWLSCWGSLLGSCVAI